MAADHLFCVRDHRQVTQAEEVHFEQPQFLERGHGELGDHLLIVARKRHIGIHRILGNDHARRVGRSVPRHSLERAGGIDQLAYLRLFVIHLFQLWINRQRLVDRDVQLVWHLLGNRVHLVIRD